MGAELSEIKNEKQLEKRLQNNKKKQSNSFVEVEQSEMYGYSGIIKKR